LRSFSPKLNVFQRLIRQWERLHPYNAAQAMRLAFDAPPDSIGRAWQQSIVALGLGRVTVVEDRVQSDYESLAVSSTNLADVGDETQFDTFLTNHLNTPFSDAALPYQPFYFRSASGTVIGLVYRHWVCDSVCIRALMHEWLKRLSATEQPSPGPLLTARHGYWHHFGPSAAGWPVFPGFLQQLTLAARLRRCRRVHVGRGASMQVQVTNLRGSDGIVASIRQASRRRGIKVNDLFLAALARTSEALSPLEPASRRSDLALGTIVDLRSLQGRPPGDAWGLFLGFTNTIVRSRILRDDERLLATIAAQSKLARSGRQAQASQVRMAFALAAGALLDDRNVKELYRKRMPLAGGISNVTLQRSWAAEAHPKLITEYMRFSPTGPFLPLVLTPTTLGDRLHLGITVRSPADPSTGETIGRRFLDDLQKLL